jgi:diguanylate cyclase (GGDEF)-like protein
MQKRFTGTGYMVNSSIVKDSSIRQYFTSPVGVITAVITVGVLGYAGWIFSNNWDPQAEKYVSSLGLVLIDLLTFAFGLVIYQQRELDRRLRLGWLCLSTGTLSSGLSIGLRFYSDISTQIDFLPVAIGLPALLYYLFTFIGILLFSLVLVTQRERTILLLDLGILMLSLSMVTWYFILASPLPTIQQVPTSLFSLAYPLADFLLLASTIALVQRDVLLYSRRILNYLAIAMLVKGVVDSLYVYLELGGKSYPLPYLSIFWLVAGLCEMTAASIQIFATRSKFTAIPSPFSASRHILRLALPYLAVAGGLGLLILVIMNTLSTDQRLLGVLFGATGLVLLVLYRQYIILQENIDLYQKMRRLAITDNLTGAYNRHFFNETLPRELERARRYEKSLTILILDLNDFKKYNDTYGHLRGDVILKMIARIFASQLRSTDTIARFGGDEFVVILPETNRHRATQVAARIQQAVTTQIEAEMPLSVSIGIASYRPGLTPEQLLDEADQDLYHQKAVYKTIALETVSQSQVIEESQSAIQVSSIPE